MHHLPVREHYLQTEAQLAHVAVGENRRAAGIGRQQTADDGRAFGTERQGKQPVNIRSGILNGFQDDTCLDCDRIAGWINVADAVQTGE